MARLPGVWGPKPRKGGEEEEGGAGGGGGGGGVDGLYTMPHSTASTSRQTGEG